MIRPRTTYSVALAVLAWVTGSGWDSRSVVTLANEIRDVARAPGLNDLRTEEHQAGPAPKLNDTPVALRFEQSGVKRSHCGPNCLYVLAKLCGVEVELEDVSRRIKVHPKDGCTLQDLVDASAALGLPTEARFIRPEDLAAAIPPMIIHCSQTEQLKGTGHFLVLVGYDRTSDRYAVVDGTTGNYNFLPSGGLMRMYTGYALAPINRSSAISVAALRVAFMTVAAVAMIYAARVWHKSGRRHAAECVRK